MLQFFCDIFTVLCEFGSNFILLCLSNSNKYGKSKSGRSSFVPPPPDIDVFTSQASSSQMRYVSQRQPARNFSTTDDEDDSFLFPKRKNVISLADDDEEVFENSFGNKFSNIRQNVSQKGEFFHVPDYRATPIASQRNYFSDRNVPNLDSVENEDVIMGTPYQGQKSRQATGILV